MQQREVAGCAETSGFQPVDANFSTGGESIRKGELLVLGIKPSPGHHVCRWGRADLFSELCEMAMILGRKQSLFDAQFTDSYLEDFEVGDLVHHRTSSAIVIVHYGILLGETV